MAILPSFLFGLSEPEQAEHETVPSQLELEKIQLWAEIQSERAEKALSKLHTLLTKLKKFVWLKMVPKDEWNDLAEWYRVHCHAFRLYAIDSLPDDTFIDGSGI